MKTIHRIMLYFVTALMWMHLHQAFDAIAYLYARNVFVESWLSELILFPMAERQ